MNTLRLHFKCYFRQYLLLSVELLLYIGILAYMGRGLEQFSAYAYRTVGFLNSSLYLSYFIFITHLFLSYEHSVLSKRLNMSEMLRTLPRGFNKDQYNILAVRIATLLLFFIVVAAMNLSVYFSLEIEQTQVFWHVLLHLLYSIFLYPLLGIVLGALVSYIRKPLNAYLSIIVLAILMSPQVSRFFYFVSDLIPFFDVVMRPAAMILDFRTPSIEGGVNAMFGYSLLPYRWELMAIWLLLSIGALIYLTSRRDEKTKRTTSIVFAVVGLYVAVIFFQPSSKVIHDSVYHDELTNDMNYYDEAEVYEAIADYEVSAYELDLRFGRKLYVDATMSLEPTTLDEYQFTLYHNYEVSSVETLEGDALEFDQEGDYLTIYNSANDLSAVRVSYAGASNKFYATVQGSYLAGYFPYYPKAGFHQVFDPQAFAFYNLFDPPNTHYKVTIEAPLEHFSNLPTIGDNIFFGQSNGLTLVSGFVQEQEVEGVRLISTYLEDSIYESDPREGIQRNIKLGILQPPLETVIITPPIFAGVMSERLVEYQDYLTVRSFDELSEYYGQHGALPEKDRLQGLFILYLDDIEELEFRNEQIAEDISEESLENNPPLSFVLSDLIERKGYPILSHFEDYLQDNLDRRSPEEFLHALDETLENLPVGMPPKVHLQVALNQYLYEPERFEGVKENAVALNNPNLDEEQRSFLLGRMTIDYRYQLWLAIEEFGEDAVIHAIEEYLEDDADRRDPITFLSELVIKE